MGIWFWEISHDVRRGLLSKVNHPQNGSPPERKATNGVSIITTLCFDYLCLYIYICIYIYIYVCVCVCFRFSIWTRRIKLSPCFGRRWEAARRAECGAVQSWRPIGPGDGEKKNHPKKMAISSINGDWPWLPACQVYHDDGWRLAAIKFLATLGMVRRWWLYHEIVFLIGLWMVLPCFASWNGMGYQQK